MARTRRYRHATTRPGPSHRPRIALYSHDAQGLGHVRRNLAIATALAPLGGDVLLLTGAPEGAVRRPAGVDLVSVPALAKDGDGDYGARHLGLGLAETLAVRRTVLEAAVRSFAPDLLIVDKHPQGFRGELAGALRDHRRRGGRAVLGLRDILDEPRVARSEWRADRGNDAVRAYYDEVWIYGDPALHDTAAAIGLRARIRYTGYLAHGRVTAGERPRGAPAGRYVLCVLGGGSDGERLARAFAATTFPAGTTGVLVTGPHLPEDARRAVREFGRVRPDLLVHSFRDDVAAWYAGADAVVSMGGYNTVCEVLATGRPHLVVPRVAPRTEQLVRAEAMAAAGALDVLLPPDVDPAALGAWLDARATPPDDAGASGAVGLDLDGLRRVPALAAHALGLSGPRLAALPDPTDQGRAEVAHSA